MDPTTMPGMAAHLTSLNEGDFVRCPDYTVQLKGGRIVLLHRSTGWDPTMLEAMIAAANADKEAA